jgi:hypothetical protein
LSAYTNISKKYGLVEWRLTFHIGPITSRPNIQTAQAWF